jgi:hypothetical protein
MWHSIEMLSGRAAFPTGSRGHETRFDAFGASEDNALREATGLRHDCRSLKSSQRDHLEILMGERYPFGQTKTIFGRWA